MMKRIVIVSYYFPPYNQVGARRAFYFAKHLSLLGNNVTVITSVLPKKYSKWNVKVDNIKIIRLPIVNKDLIKFLPSDNKFVRFLNILLSPLEAHNRVCLNDININNFLKPDYIIATGGPWHVFEIGVGLKQKFKNSKLILDYRDAWTIYDNRVKLDSLSNFGTGIGKIKEYIYKRKERRLLTYANAITSVTKPVLDNVIKNPKNKSDVKYKVIYNGFDRLNFGKKIRNNKFIIIYAGILKKEQEHNLFLNGYEMFLENPKVNKELVLCMFLGSDHPKLKHLVEPFKLFKHSKNIMVSPFLDKKELLKIQKEASIFLNFSFTGKIGIMTGKMMEYLALEKNILVVSKNDDIMEEVIAKTKTGRIAKSEQDVCEILLNWYNEFIKKGSLDYNIDKVEVSFYENQTQVRILNDFLGTI